MKFTTIIMIVVLTISSHALSAQKKRSNDIYLLASQVIKEANNGNTDISISIADNIIKKYPNNYIGYYVKAYGMFHIPGKMQDGLIDNLNKCLELNPKYAPAYSLRGILSPPDNISQKISDYTLAVKYGTDKKEIADDYAKLASLKMEALDLNGALDAANKCLTLDKSNYEGYRNRGQIYIELKNYYSALSDLDNSISIYPDDAFCYLYRGIAKANMNNTESACKDFERARLLIQSRQFDETIEKYCK
ncbi:tetratricopeptide repeat protein [Mucilaginibacter flavus]|uniref:tetratricopeptide repeat protein n=1 Tax=Mucilaginibacter flavus TaxID=931504 RepID=UPI0025B4553D|nr:hypothetical protein [Mucilaginibacter flavus]MDN3582690.1 hypothetical protein [Mucilaginibacter flavus]